VLESLPEGQTMPAFDFSFGFTFPRPLAEGLA